MLQGYPLHMNLAVSQPFSPQRHPADSDEQNRVAMIKAQNKMLTQVRDAFCCEGGNGRATARSLLVGC